ncbi:SDR family oxidoreductase [Mycolicibacterium goodii]|uniref:3-beta hydroxysteroid dehydrogenase n=1 Tax=Mycolicibacterium goodii TaxID=134601 RepID=A0A0K0X9Z4_MYCGD|nr:3-beta hydroxysteroid dehydrogenase [Mycolicibacterium goodii]
MRVFVTGASGFIGTAVCDELIAAGHEVTGLARSDASAQALAKAGRGVHRGDLNDLDSLRSGAAAADGVIHLAFVHDFADFAGSAQTDRLAIETLGDALAGSDRPLIVAAGIAGLPAGTTEDDPTPPGYPRFSEPTVLEQVSKGVRASAVRLPPSVHGAGDYGFVPELISVARTRGVSGYPGEGANVWSAVHRADAARVFRRALEDTPAGSRWHAVAEEGIPAREIAETIGRNLGIPVASIPQPDVTSHFGWIGSFFSLDANVSGALTRQRLGWEPTGPGLLADLDAGHYFQPGLETVTG